MVQATSIESARHPLTVDGGSTQLQGHGHQPLNVGEYAHWASVLGGGVGRIRGLDVMNIVTSYMGVQEKYGA